MPTTSPRFVRPAEIEWQPHPKFRGVQNAVLHGDPGQHGMYVLRVRVESGVSIDPHTHPEDRVYTVLSGVFGIGFGERFDLSEIQQYPEGSVVFLPARSAHFHFASGNGYVVQINGWGPTSTDLVDARPSTTGPPSP
jgi:quercetin dioxygenase-like cupin family protein